MNGKTGKVRINKVKDRILFLSPSVKLGHENEATLKDFDIGDMLGTGAFGQVYKVTHKLSKRVFALKVIEKAKIKKNKMENQIQNEVKIMYSLDNENIVRLFNHFEDDQNIYLVIEFAEEGQLMNKLKKAPGKKLPETVAVLYIRDLVKALDYIHNLNPPIIHRDIKPENLLVAAGNCIKLGDFGWSNYNEDSRTTYCGTPEYLAPEMLQQRGHTDKLDIWCVGILIFELLTGRTPFLPRKPTADANERDRALKKGILEGKPQIPAEFPALARDLVIKLLKANPKERLSLAEIKKHPWFKQLGISFGDEGLSRSTSGTTGVPAKPILAASLITISEKEELKSLQVSGIDLPMQVPELDTSPLAVQYEMDGLALEKSELLREMPDISDTDASLFFRRESILAPLDLPALDGFLLPTQDRQSIVEKVAEAMRKSAGMKLNENLAKLNDQLAERDRRIRDLQSQVDSLESDKSRLRAELERTRAGMSFTVDEQSFASITMPSLESKLSKFVEEDRDKLRSRVEELYKIISLKEEAIDLLTGKVGLSHQMRKYEALEKSNEELRAEKMELQAQLRDKEDQMNCFSSMVVETKQNKNKEISELEKKIEEYENKLFIRSKENNELIVRELLEFTNDKFCEISQTIKAYQSQKNKYNELLAKYQELEARAKRAELTHKNEVLDLKASMNDIIEEQAEQHAAKFQHEIGSLKSEILRIRMECEETILKKNGRIAELEREIVEVRALVEKMTFQERQIKELEQGLEVKTFLILNKEREVSRLKQRLDEIILLNTKLKQANQANQA